jgi:hypothetical protein
VTSTPVQVATYTATATDGSTQFNLVLAPALRDQVAELAQDPSLQDDAPSKRATALQVSARAPGSGLLNFDGDAFKSALRSLTIGAVVAGLTTLAVDVAAPVVTVVAGLAVVIGGITYAFSAVSDLFVTTYGDLARSWNIADGPLPASVTLDLSQITPLDKCPAEDSTSCDDASCAGNILFVCTSVAVSGCMTSLPSSPPLSPLFDAV